MSTEIKYWLAVPTHRNTLYTSEYYCVFKNKVPYKTYISGIFVCESCTGCYEQTIRERVDVRQLKFTTGYWTITKLDNDEVWIYLL